MIKCGDRVKRERKVEQRKEKKGNENWNGRKKENAQIKE